MMPKEKPGISVTYDGNGIATITVGNPHMGDKDTVECILQSFCIFVPNTWWHMDKRVEWAIGSCLKQWYAAKINRSKSWGIA